MRAVTCSEAEISLRGTDVFSDQGDDDDDVLRIRIISRRRYSQQLCIMPYIRPQCVLIGKENGQRVIITNHLARSPLNRRVAVDDVLGQNNVNSFITSSSFWTMT